jgi:lipid II:glycine glycyltransferase (peptidoglycan interpeptide bridge formation enzyme)
VDLHQSPAYAKYMASLGWKIERVQGVNVFIKKLFFFYLIKIQRYSKKLDLTFLKRYWPILVLKLEPRTQNLVTSDLKKDSSNLLPTKTIIVDLKNLNLEKDVRYEIRKAVKSGLIVSQQCSNEAIEQFIKSWHQHAHDRGFWVPFHKEIRNLVQNFGQNCQIFITYYLDDRHGSMFKPLAGALVTTAGDTTNYMYAFSTKEGRRVSAPYLVLAKIIEDCQKRKIRYLDLQGIYDERFPNNNKKWQGFSAFKKQWGGKVIEYPGSYVKYF